MKHFQMNSLCYDQSNEPKNMKNIRITQCTFTYKGQDIGYNTSLVDIVDELVSIRDTGSESDSILWMWSPDHTSETLNVDDPLVTLSVVMESPKQNDFPTTFLMGIGRISGSSICM